MILAHLPAGYLVSRAFKAQRGPILWAALIGAVLPDFDMFWFHLIDHASIHHHRYWVHAPGFWVIVAALVLPVIAKLWPDALKLAIVFFTSVLIHLILDTVGGGIMWVWPFSQQLYSLITVPAAHSHWVISFLLHWSFLAELSIVATALWFFFSRKLQTP